MADRVKGITVEFDGDTSKLNKALKDIRKEAGAVDKELKDVNKLLKFNPKNAELLAQKQTLLKNKIADTEQSLKNLKAVQDRMDADGVDKNSEAYRKVRREIVEADSKLKHYNAELKKTERESSKIYRTGDAFKTAGGKIEGAGRALQGVSRAAAAVAVALAGITVKAARTADDINTLSKVTGMSTHDLQMYAAMADLVDVSVEDMAKAHTRLKKSMASSSNAKYFEQLGVQTKNADGSLRDANEVFDETIAALGKMENETERDAIAMAIMGKSANNLNPLIEDGGRTYEKVAKLMKEYGLEPVDQETLDKANEFNDALDTIKLMFLQTVQIVGSKIAAYLLPMINKVVKVVGKFSKWFTSLSGKTQARIMGLASAVALLSPALIILGKTLSMVGMAMQNATTIIGGLSKAFAFLAANPIVAVIAVIGLLVARFIYLWKTSEQFRQYWINLWTNFKNMVSSSVGRVVQEVQGMWNKIKAVFAGWSAFWSGLWGKVKNGFANIGTSFGHAIGNAVKAAVNGVISRVERVINTAIALLNSAIAVADKLTPGNLPRIKPLHLPRLAKGGILNGAQTVIAGEAGPEAIIPLDELWKHIDAINGGETIINVYGAEGQSVNELAAAVERRLIAAQKRRSMAWA